MRSDVDIDSHGTRLSAWHYVAESDALTKPAGRPLVVMAHGLGLTKDCALEPFAERFQAAGADVLVFDYRGFGTSDGATRQQIDHRRQREDYRAVVAHARVMPGVDPDRIVLWGFSYSGGHVVAVAAKDPRIAGVISLAPATDGLAAVFEILRYSGPGQLLRLTGHALRDAAGAAIGRPPHLISVVGPPGSLAAITSADGESGYAGTIGPTFRNEMQARGLFPAMFNRPVTLASRLRMPLLVVIAERDTIAPTAAVDKTARRAGGPVRVERLDVLHFDIFSGEPFDQAIAAQVEFLGTLTGARMDP